MSKKPTPKPGNSKTIKKSKGDGDGTKPNIRRVPVADIIVAEKEFRPLDEKTVKDLVESFSEVGLMHPPTVFIRKPKDEPDAEEIHLVAGHHRLTAAKKAGWKYIDVIVVKRDKDKNLMRQTTENLHRNPLTKQQQGQQTKQWLEMHLAKEGAKPQQPHDKGISAAAKALGKSRRTIKRLLEAGAIVPNAAVALHKAKLDNNGQVLGVIAHLKPEKQVARVERIVSERAKKSADRKARANAKIKDNEKDKSKGKGRESALSARAVVMRPIPQTPYDKLMEGWDKAPDLQQAWTEADEGDQRQFIEDVLDFELEELEESDDDAEGDWDE